LALLRSDRGSSPRSRKLVRQTDDGPARRWERAGIETTNKEPAMSLPRTRPSAARRAAVAAAACALALAGASSAVAANCTDCDPGGGGGGGGPVAPVAAFTATVAGHTVVVDGAATTQSPTSETWSFGDGASGSGTLAMSHTYTHPGTFHVTLTASNSVGSNSVTHDVVIADSPPTASITASDASPLSGEAITFTGHAVDTDGAITAEQWSFGDGSSPATGSDVVSHNYVHAGTYTVTLRVTDDQSVQTVVTKAISVGDRPPAASFTVPTGAVVGEVVTFPVRASDSDGTVDDYEFDYGDGASGFGFPQGHETYKAPGTYTVTLTVTDDGGASTTVSHDVVIGPAPVDQPDPDPTHPQPQPQPQPSSSPSTVTGPLGAGIITTPIPGLTGAPQGQTTSVHGQSTAKKKAVTCKKAKAKKHAKHAHASKAKKKTACVTVKPKAKAKHHQ
jgi:PKD repeat protein